MRFAVAIVSAPNYPHSEAFREVAEALHHGLTALGHDSVLTGKLTPDARQTIVLGSNLLPALGQRPPPRAILYNLEQIQAGSTWLTPQLLALFREFPVWDYSEGNIARLVELGVPPPRLMPVGYVPELTRIAPAAEDIDVLFYGSMNERRHRVIEALRARGLRVETLFSVYGPARDAVIARSKLVLNVHFYEAKVFEAVRVSYLLANRRAVVSERGAVAEEEAPFADGVAFAAYHELVDRCVELVRDGPARAELAERGFRAISGRRQADFLRAALSRTEAAA